MFDYVSSTRNVAANSVAFCFTAMLATKDDADTKGHSSHPIVSQIIKAL